MLQLYVDNNNSAVSGLRFLAAAAAAAAAIWWVTLRWSTFLEFKIIESFSLAEIL
jgi:hypothetical protein